MEPSLDVMRTLSATERDLIRLIVETVQELRDAAYGDDDDDEPAVSSYLIRKFAQLIAECSKKQIPMQALRPPNRSLSPPESHSRS